jgi:hypothetical protein
MEMKLERLMKSMFRLVFRLVLLMAGLVFLASLMVFGLVLLALWLVRALFARLTGRPVTPWTFKVNRQAQWSRFYQASSRGNPAQVSSDVIDAEVKEVKETPVKQFLER